VVPVLGINIARSTKNFVQVIFYAKRITQEQLAQFAIKKKDFTLKIKTIVYSVPLRENLFLSQL
jgi:hypothetical protein